MQSDAKVEVVEIKRHGLHKQLLKFGMRDHGREIPRRVRDMGLVPGTRAKVVSNNLGMVVLEVRGNRLALGKGLCKRILVKLVN